MRELNLVFYADGGQKSGQDNIWVQDALTVTVAMLKRMELETNLYKTNLMVCTPGFIWRKWSKEA